MRTTLVIVALIVPVIALALPDDATLSRLLVGTWQGPRHETQYRADGTWVLDPPDEGDNSRGKWRIEHGRLIETWRFSGESSDSTSVDEIIDRRGIGRFAAEAPRLNQPAVFDPPFSARVISFVR